ncbi:uncharacterized protein LOC114257933 isoform X1 [Camellia sinensis]|uniref:uncharacterized protein LOC114257933 isoform X1 n=1 Tax=Camellia sinensis TaxID=4442 RepID=UPI00103643DC|nr:uncharacterized protein LOC114257933 isoform X1 [Camellia sinensis]
MKRAEYFSSLPSSSSFFNTPSHTSIDAHSWLVAEQSVQRILSTIQPTVASEHRRNEVIGYLQNIIREYFGTEVLPFGSVPLKTYLPDGDIDLTVVCRQSTVEDLTGYICSFLEREGKKDTEFVIKKVEYIHAQVRLVKCVVQDIAVDISFNQIAGLSALCFLERVDQFIGRDHLFKRSIILIKAWCHYESRILGALHGLISTYALDLLVLHIINLFHSSIDGPFSVLFRFLDYYSTFDWKKYCVSLNGPVSISSLPEIMVGAPQNDGSDLLLSKEFLKNETDIFSVSTWELETREQAFPLKHLNIIDPLKDNNNLGRSVCQGNFYRIGYALSYAARKLEEVIMLPPERIDEGLKKFFENTLNWNAMGRRQDVRVPVPVFGFGEPEVSDLSVDYNSYFTHLMYFHYYHNQNSSIRFGPPTLSLQFANLYFVYPTNTEGFVPRPFYLPYVAQSSSTALGDEEIMKFLGTGTYFSTGIVAENLYSQGIGTYIPIMESRGTGMFIPNIRIEEKMPQARCIVGMDVEDKVKSEGRFIPDKGVKEKGKMSLGRAICISGMDVEGKVKSIGAETFISNKGVEEMKIPNMDVEEMNKSQGSVTKILDVGVEEKSQPGGTATYILNVGINKNGESQGSGIYNHYVGVEGNTKSQGKGKHSSELVYQPGGTATYILNVGINKNAESQGSGIDNHYVGVEGNTKSQGKGKHSSELERESPKKQMHIWEREIDAGQKTLGLMPKSSLKNEHVNVLSETEDSCGCIDLSLEDLPHLSATKKTIPSKAPQPDQATIESSQAKKSSHLSKRVEFGFFGPSLPPLILSSPMADSEQPESSEHKEDRIPVQPYRLTDEKDFPPLSQ